MSSTTEIANLALSYLGVTRPLANLETTQSATAFAIKTQYTMALKDALKGFYWPFAGRYVTLAMVEDFTDTDTTFDWPYSYRYPVDALTIRRVQNPGVRSPTNYQRISYLVGGDDSGQLIYTTITPAEVWVTKYIDNPMLYPSDFVIALAAKLAFLAGPSIAGGTATALIDKAAALYNFQIRVAQRNALNEQQADVEKPSKLEQSRHGSSNTDGWSNSSGGTTV